MQVPIMASLFASQRTCAPSAVPNCRGIKSAFHIIQRTLPPAAAATISSSARESRTAGDRIARDVAGCSRTVRRQLQVAHGASKASLYTQLPDRLDEPTPGFDSIAEALEDLAAGRSLFCIVFMVLYAAIYSVGWSVDCQNSKAAAHCCCSLLLLGLHQHCCSFGLTGRPIRTMWLLSCLFNRYLDVLACQAQETLVQCGLLNSPCVCTCV